MSRSAHLLERLEENVHHRRWHVLLAQGASQANRLPHLFYIGGTPVAPREVTFEDGPLLDGKGTFEIVGHHRDRLVAREILIARHGVTARAKFCSRTDRTLPRARCKRMRWFPSLIANAEQTSSGLQPSTSRKAITSRCWRGSDRMASKIRVRVSSPSRRAAATSVHGLGGSDQCPAHRSDGG